MASIRKGNQSILLVIDSQVGVLSYAHNKELIIMNIKKVIDKARSDNIPVIWVQHSDERLIANSENWKIVPELQVRDNEFKIEKHFNSCFEETELENILGNLNATNLVLVGAATNWCVRATAYAALERGYDVTLVEDAHSTNTMRISEDKKIEAIDIITELNIAINWTSYPGRRGKTQKTDEIDFLRERNCHE
ncbi:MAG: cysteine hydrolase [Candidatus Cloacimonetes bacterium]|nr:cysteine hydrolase [Candidatus Cloacimonadota bacterium]